MEEINFLTLQLAKKYTDEHGGGGGGTSNYNDLSHRPQINSTTLEGNMSLSDLGIASATDLSSLSGDVSSIKDGQTIDSFADVESTLADKVDKVAGKGLSTNDYTDADKAIVGGVTAALAGKVDKVEGKGLSTNDFTDAYKTAIGDNTTAISGIKNGASINSFGGVETALADKADKSAVKNEFIGTTAEWNALTTAQKKAYDTYQITDDYTAGGGGLPDYSTTEQLTGQKWIDGKDIYFKTYTNLQMSNNTPVVVDSNFGSTNKVIDMRVILDGTSLSQTHNQCIASAYNEGGTYSVFPQVDGDNLQIIIRGNWTNYTASLVIYYTKTT